MPTWRGALRIATTFAYQHYRKKFFRHHLYLHLPPAAASYLSYAVAVWARAWTVRAPGGRPPAVFVEPLGCAALAKDKWFWADAPHAASGG